MKTSFWREWQGQDDTGDVRDRKETSPLCRLSKLCSQRQRVSNIQVESATISKNLLMQIKLNMKLEFA